MATVGHSSAKRRRLEGLVSPILASDRTMSVSDYCHQEAHLPTDVEVDGPGVTTVVIPDNATELICFGMLMSLTASATPGHTDQQSAPFGSLLRLGSDGKLYPSHLDTTCGKLTSRDTELLHLFCREGIEFDLLWMPEQSERGKDAEGDTPVWATLYGSRDLASDLRDVLQKLELYLQDPTHAQKHVRYFNPQRFFNDTNARTSDFQLDPSRPQPTPVFRDERVAAVDVLGGHVTETDLDETEGSRYLKTNLKRHQKEGLTFMVRRETGWRLPNEGQDVWSGGTDEFGRVIYVNNIESSTQHRCPPSFRGGILADPMGLGKTLSIISLIAQDKGIDKESRPSHSTSGMLGRGTLIVLPSSLLQNWEEELSRHLSAEDFFWHRHHGRHRITCPADLGFCDIVLISYTTLAREWQSQIKGQESALLSHTWHRVVLDEAHEIKNLSTAKARAACSLTADCRWAVTGTPIQNRLSELFSLIHFLRLSPYDEKKNFDAAITNPWLRGDGVGLQALMKLLGYIMLRRPKTAVTLPNRKDHRRLLSLNTQDQDAYEIAKKKAVECLETALSSNEPQDGYRNALEKINVLRAICELGCLPPKSALLQVPNLSCDRGLTPGTSEGSLTPSAAADDIEDNSDKGGLDSSGGMLSDLQQAILSTTRPPSCPSPGFDCRALTGSLMVPDQWPTKIQALVQDIKTCSAGIKSVVFSYRTSVLNVANLALAEVGISCVQLDGSLSAKKRNQIIMDFSNKEDLHVLLLSLGCGAVGAYLMEPQWNPAIEEQALARIYRLGQTQEVTTIRFIISGSIEQYVLDIQDGKQDLIGILNHKPGGQAATKLQVGHLPSLKLTLVNIDTATLAAFALGAMKMDKT